MAGLKGGEVRRRFEGTFAGEIWIMMIGLRSVLMMTLINNAYAMS